MLFLNINKNLHLFSNPKPIEDHSLLSEETIANKIYYIRNQKMMPDRDLASLYGIETRVLKQAVKRNLSRFAEDFMFELTKIESDSLRSQIVSLKKGRGEHQKYYLLFHQTRSFDAFQRSKKR